MRIGLPLTLIYTLFKYMEMGLKFAIVSHSHSTSFIKPISNATGLRITGYQRIDVQVFANDHVVIKHFTDIRPTTMQNLTRCVSKFLS